MPTTPGGFCRLGQARDLRDAEAILLALKGAALVYDDYTSAANKQIREVISHYWQYPRIPKSRMIAAQYPESCLWSPLARERWEALPINKRGQRVGGSGAGLRLEHLVPMSLLRDSLLPQLDSFTTESFAEHLRRHHESALMIVITTEEDNELTRAGLKSTTLDVGDPWARYRPIGLTPQNCRPIDVAACHCA